MSSWRNRLARSTVNREVAGSIPAEDVFWLVEHTQFSKEHAFRYNFNSFVISVYAINWCSDYDIGSAHLNLGVNC